MNKRIRQIIDYYSLSTRQFEQKISVSNGVIAKVLAQNTTLRSDILSKIADTFPEVNMGWLLTGKGEMLRVKEGERSPISTDKDKKIFELQEKYISLLERYNRLVEERVPSPASLLPSEALLS